MNSQYVLGSFAILALLQKEQGHERVFEILNESQKGTARVMMTWGKWLIRFSADGINSKPNQLMTNLETSNVEFVDAGQELSLITAEY